MYNKIFKRLIDIVLSMLGLILLSWLFFILIIAIKLDSPGPVFFTQDRIGIIKSHFQIHKFRTMRIDAPHDMPTHLLKNPDQWITKTGGLMQKLSLDELPQIWDIFVGERDIIGTTKKNLEFTRGFGFKSVPLFEIFYGNWSGSENLRGEDGFLDTHELIHNPE